MVMLHQKLVRAYEPEKICCVCVNPKCCECELTISYICTTMDMCCKTCFLSLKFEKQPTV